MSILLIVAGLILLVSLTYAGRGYWAWVGATVLALAAWWLAGIETPALFNGVAGIAIALERV